MTKKVDLDILINELLERIREIDADNSTPQSEKTKAHRRAAESFRNKLHDDQRRVSESKISLTTYRRYITLVRKAVTAQNWKHHGLENTVKSICNKFPDISEKLISIIAIDDVTEMRKARHVFLKSLTKFESQFQAVKEIKLDHEVMRWLILSDAQKAQLTQHQSTALEQKKTSVIWLRADDVIDGIENLLTKKSKTIDNEKAFAFSKLALGIAMATGRRQIEVVRQGRFKKIDDHRLEFSGHAKKRGGPDFNHKSIIYSLVPSDLVLTALKNLRELPEIKELEQYNELSLTEQNRAINHRIAQTCNTQAKKFFNDQNRVFKDSRAIWARISHDKFFASDPVWKDVDEDVFWREMLGHEDIETQKSYKQFKIVYGARTEEAEAKSNEPKQPDTLRLEALKAFDEHEGIISGRAIQRLHNNVKMAITAEPDFIITQNALSREFGTSRPAIKKYLVIVGTAIETQLKPIEKKSNVELKPALKAKQLPDGQFKAWAMLGDAEIASVTIKGTYLEAMTAIYKKISET